MAKIQPRKRGIATKIGMEIDRELQKKKCREDVKMKINTGGCNAVYSLGFIGAAVYFIKTATGFWMGVLGVLKAIVWPAIPFQD